MSSLQADSDVILIGAGIMSATLGSLLKELAPTWSIQMYEQLDGAGEESSNEWNNAGTGHSALCELNYTKANADGTIDCSKALQINEQFQLSRQFWSFLVESGLITDPQSFIRPIPHMSFVEGAENKTFLRKRYEALSQSALFHGMEYTEDAKKLQDWMPLIMEGRTLSEPVAATRNLSGTDVNFGALTRQLIAHLQQVGVGIHYQHKVRQIRRLASGRWQVTVQNLKTSAIQEQTAKFIFIGAGGGSLPLLRKTGIPEAAHIGGFPVSGLFMVCKNEQVIARHHAKVYGKAKIGAPPMSVPHLDTRYIDGRKSLLFGPYAGFSPKFLKNGSYLDLFRSIRLDNIVTMLAAGAKEMALTKYLIQQVLLSNEKRMDALREFIPHAQTEDWQMVVAGQRVQVIKDTEANGRGTLQFGTEVVTAADGSIAALLGASPGASTAVHVMLDVLNRCFPQNRAEWAPKINRMIPSYGRKLSGNDKLGHEIQTRTSDVLGLTQAAFT